MKRLFRPVACLLMALPPASQAIDVIAHESVVLTGDEVRDTFLGEKVLAGTVKLVPIDNSSSQEEFLSKVLQTDREKYYARWAKKLYREGLSTPPTKGTDAEVTAFVKATPGAIGYVSKAAPGVKVLHSY
jgi:ABC-type phosphate transport system substrate-binding protein